MCPIHRFSVSPHAAVRPDSLRCVAVIGACAASYGTLHNRAVAPLADVRAGMSVAIEGSPGAKGSGNAHDDMQPCEVARIIIKT